MYLEDEDTGEYIGWTIIETDAYLSEGDLAAHNARGKTNANKSLFDEAGTMYIHSMRQYLLLDFVTEGKDKPWSVLIRAIEPKLGIDKMFERRKVKKIHDLCNGPGKLCIALGIKKEFDGINIFDDSSPVKLVISENYHDTSFSVSKRIGITKNSDANLRFTLSGSSFVSK